MQQTEMDLSRDSPLDFVKFAIFAILFAVQPVSAQYSDNSDSPEPASFKPFPREFRAAWLATVDNIDWPTERGLTAERQMAELTSLFDRAVELNLNAIIFQIRPAADALYRSDLEPWSEYLTGEMGAPPEPEYDPLTFAVAEAHARGLELHAWFNPFRAHHPTATGPISSNHISRTRPDLVRSYGDQLWLDPGEPDAVAYSLAVIMDVVERYDIDGVHIDDYFYPYPVKDDAGVDIPFPDDQSWEKALGRGETMTRDDWRRANVDNFVERMYAGVKASKTWVKVGISPFGIWRPGYPESVTGFDAYARLYADARKWVVEGWLDYITPQLYWSIESEGQSYPALLEWWSGQNTAGRHLWPGNFASRTIAEGARRWEPDEIIDQVLVTRASPEATGNVHFSIKALLRANGTLGARLVEGVYAEPALVPASPWLGDVPPAQPRVTISKVSSDGKGVTFELTPVGDESTTLWAILLRNGDDEWFRVLPAGALTTGSVPSFLIAADDEFGMPQEVDVIAVSR
ncbi:MAG: glycoside hydrolase family 10 protein, partial [Rhodothermia bacterium]